MRFGLVFSWCLVIYTCWATVDDNPFISKWDTSQPGISANTQITLPLVSSGSYDFDVNWGDGSTAHITSFKQPEVTHTYEKKGKYTITIKGLIKGWRFNGGGDALKLIDISHWGDLKVGNKGKYFKGCANLRGSFVDKLDTSGTTNFREFFAGCSKFNGDISDWDTSEVRNMHSMFHKALKFNSDISAWDTSEVTNMKLLFHTALSFKGNIDHWDVGMVTSFDFMFGPRGGPGQHTGL